MALDLEKMRDRCRTEQWNVDDFDWTTRPIELDREAEIQLCSYYVNMSYIERLAGALFLSLSERLDDPDLKEIFRSFHTDELRHSHAAARLADYFDQHHYQLYTPNIPMLRFMPRFHGMIDSIHPAFATSLILGGELILDIALLRGLNEFVHDPLSRAVVEKINQDESRHLAMDLYMTEYFAREVGDAVIPSESPWVSADFWGVLTWGPGFFAEVFFRPMQTLDPTQEQMRKVMRRLRRFYDRPSVRANPAVDQFRSVVAFLETSMGSVVGETLESVIRTTSGIDFSFVHAASTDELYPSPEGTTPETATWEIPLLRWAS